jgi:hypothetical protein
MAALHGPYAFARDEVCFYDEPDYDGEHFCTSHSIRNLANDDWNDDISSMELYGDIEVVLFEHADYRGRSHHYTRDTGRIRGRLDNEASSLKIIGYGGYRWEKENIDRSQGRYDWEENSYDTGRSRSEYYKHSGESSNNHKVLNKESNDGWQLQQFCNCRTGKRCYVKGHSVGQCVFQCPSGCKG